jgi:hypothetical protein
VSICSSFLNLNHQSNVISNLKNNKNLPFSEILPKKELIRYLQDTESRERVYTPEVTLWAFLSQVLDEDKSQQAAVSRVIAAYVAQRKKPPSANTSAYCQARSRLSEDTLSILTRETAKQEVSNIPKPWLWKGKHIKLVDGSTLSMPDTVKNQLEYPQPTSQKKGVGFPMARIVVIVDYITGMLLDFAMGQYSGENTGEHALLRQLMSSFNTDDIMLGDAYYPSFFLMATLIDNGISGIFPAKTARKCDFRSGKRLGKKDHIATWKKPNRPAWMTKTEYDEFPKEILVREVAIERERPGFRTKIRVLVTTFLDPIEISKSDLCGLYDYRWFVEITLRSIKTTMQMDALRGKTPGMVRKEIWMHFLAYNLIRKIMAQAAWAHGKQITSLSFKLTLQLIKAFQQAGLLNYKNPEQYEYLLEAIVYKKVANRPGRQEPRCVKRRPKTFPKLQKARELYKNAA